MLQSKTTIRAALLLVLFPFVAETRLSPHSDRVKSSHESMWVCGGYKYNPDYATEKRLKKQIRGL